MYSFNSRPRKTPNLIHDKEVYITEKFCREPINWAREMKMARKLYLKFSDISFWEYLELPKKLNSLAFFLCYDGKKLLTNKYSLFTLEIQPTSKVEVGNEKLGEDRKIEKKKTLLELIT